MSSALVWDIGQSQFQLWSDSQELRMSTQCLSDVKWTTPCQHQHNHMSLSIVYFIPCVIVCLELYATIASWHQLIVWDVLAEIINIFTGKKKEVQHVKMDGDLSQRSGWRWWGQSCWVPGWQWRGDLHHHKAEDQPHVCGWHPWLSQLWLQLCWRTQPRNSTQEQTITQVTEVLDDIILNIRGDVCT